MKRQNYNSKKVSVFQLMLKSLIDYFLVKSQLLNNMRKKAIYNKGL